LTRERLLPLLGLLLLAALYLGEIGGYPLQDPDEGRYAEIPREMLETGDWVTPKLNYVVYFEKPPLFYWAVALAFEAFGMTEGAARVVPAAAGIATIVLVWWLGVPLFGRRAALIGAGVLATMPIFFVLSQALTMDSLLTAFMTATMVSFYAAHAASSDVAKRRWAVAVSVAAALGVLTKGPVALALPGLIALAFLLLNRDWATLRALVRPLPILAFLLITVPWFVLVARANPDFLSYFFVREHFERFTAEVGHPEGPFFYIPVLLAGPLPWSVVAIALALTREGRAAFAEIPRAPRTFLLLWGGITIAFFTVASSKLATYILPALPPLALVAGAWLERVLARETLSSVVTRVLGFVLLGLGVVGVVAAALAWLLEDTFAEAFKAGTDDVGWIALAAARAGTALAVGGFLVAYSRYGQGLAMPARLSAVILTIGLAVYGALPARGVVKTSRALADEVNAARQPGDLVVLYRKLWQGLPFYTRGRVHMIKNYDEVWHGVEISPERDRYYWKDLSPLASEWSSGRRVFLLTNDDLVPDLAAGIDAEPRVVARDRRRVLVVNFPETAAGAEPDGEGRASALPLEAGGG